MAKKMIKSTLLAAILGSICQFSGCGIAQDTWIGRLFWVTVGYSGLEFLLDNDGVFDLFEDGNVAAAA